MKGLVIFIIVIVLIVAGVVLFRGDESVDDNDKNEESIGNIEERMEDEDANDTNESMSDSKKDDNMKSDDAMNNDGVDKEVFLVKYISDGYEPSSLSINKGDTVTFINESNKGVWTASNIHPRHESYPDSSISKCSLPESERTEMFDACQSVQKGESWSFTFNRSGAWEYHNHRSSNDEGVIVVK